MNDLELLEPAELWNLVVRLFPEASSIFQSGCAGSAKGGNPCGKLKRVAVAAADHVAALQSIQDARVTGLADFILFAVPEALRDAARQAGVDLSPYTLAACSSHEEAAEAAASAAAAGEADILMKGAVHTSDFTRAALDKRKGLIAPGRLMSHVAAFSIPGYDRTLLVTDCAVNIAPDFGQKQAILDNAVRTARALGIGRPKIACICPVETVNPKIPSTIDAHALQELQERERCFGDAEVIGPIALDAALSAEAAVVKGIGGDVPGKVDILLLPGLDAGNVLYKAFAFQPGALTAGVVAGLDVPMVLTSRSDCRTVRYLSLAMALMTSDGRA